MRIAVVPPEFLVLPPQKNLQILDQAVLLNPILQKRIFRSMKFPLKNIDEVISIKTSSGINEEAEQIASSWYRKENLGMDFSFSGVPLGPLFDAEITYFFIGVLKAIEQIHALFEAVSSHDAYVLLDDGSLWAAIFKGMADQKNIKIEISRQNLLSPKEVGRDFLKKWAKRIWTFFQIPNDNRLSSGGVLYSAAPKFVEPLWKGDASIASYYLRPELSIKTLEKIRLHYPNLHHVLPGKSRSRTEYFDLNGFKEQFQIFLKSEAMFQWRGFFYGPVIDSFFFKKIANRLAQSIQWISSLQDLLDQLSPRTVIVDEDVTPFNQILVALANKRGIPSVQIQHGIMGFRTFMVPIKTSCMIVPGETSRQRLLAWGAESERIAVTGAPHYEAQIQRMTKTSEKKDVLNILRIEKNRKILLLATHPFHTEDKPDWIGIKDTPAVTAAIIKNVWETVREHASFVLVIKLHPRDPNEWYTRQVLRELNAQDKVKVIREFDILSLIGQSELVLCGLSTVYLEALLLERPVLLLDDSRERNLSFLSRTFLDLESQEKFKNSLNNYLLNPSLRQVRLVDQKEERERHFIKSNEGSIARFWNLVHALSLKTIPNGAGAISHG